MANLARKNAGYPIVRREADRALSGIWDREDPPTRKQLANGIWNHVKDRVTFVTDESVLMDEFGVDPQNELLIEPSVLFQMEKPRGDCDDFSMATAALLLVAGLPAYYTTIAADREAPDRWSHVYVGTILEDGTLYPLDTSHGHSPGWEKENPYRKQHWLVYVPKGEGVGMIGPEDRAVVGSAFPGMRGLGEDQTTINFPWLTEGSFPADVTTPPIFQQPSAGVNWGNTLAQMLGIGANTASRIALANAGVPQIGQGQYYTNQRTGVTTYSLGPGGALQSMPGSSSLWLVGGLLAVVAVIAAVKR